MPSRTTGARYVALCQSVSRILSSASHLSFGVLLCLLKGASGYNAAKKNHILIHEVAEKEVKPKLKK
jgi:hypothetical protein